MKKNTKYKKIYDDMVNNNKEIFAEFEKLHTLLIKDRAINQKEFNRVGKEVMKIIKDYESRLCNTSENSGFSKYSTKLSEKFYEEIRLHFPLIDMVGMK